MRHPFLPIVCATAALLTACGGTTVQYVPTNPPPRALAPRTAAAVEVFTSRAPERPYSDVGYLEVEENDGYTRADSERLLGELREAAASRGCDGLVVSGEVERTPHHGVFRRHPVRALRGTCIVFAPREVASMTR